MKRSLKLSMLVALALGSVQVAAVELGPVHVRSMLGQPLVADVPITQATPAELRTLTAQLSQNAAPTGAAPSVPLQFAITGSGSRRWIRITSRDPVQDPYLDLMIEVSAAGSSSTHEVTLLLDPPGEDVQEPAAPTAPIPAAAPPPAPVQATVAEPTPAPRPARAAAPVVASAPGHASASDRYGPVAKGQTLFSVVRATAPTGVDVNQMLLALKQANPDAFFRDNINALKSGAILRMPSRDATQAVSADAAAALVRQQNDAWRHGTGTPVTVADAATRANASSSPAASAGGQDRLALVPPAGKGSDKASRQALARDQEALTALQQQDAELKSRIKDLQDISDKNQRLLALKDNQIAQLQNQLAAARKAAGLPALARSVPAANALPAMVAPAHSTASPASAASTHAMMPAVASTASRPAASGSAAAVPAHAATAMPKASAPAATPTAKPVVAHPAAPAVEETPWFMRPLVWIAVLLVLILLLLLGLRGRRRGASEPSRASLADRFPAAPASESPADSDQDELLDQLAEHPDNLDLHLELVTLYYRRRDVDHFEAAAEAMYAHISDPQQDEWQDVVHMGRELAPGHPLFAEHADHVDPAASGMPAATVADKEFHHAFDAAPQFNLPPQQGAVPKTAIPPRDAEPWHGHDPSPVTPAASATDGAFPATPRETLLDHSVEGFSDDPNDTKLDLARAYLDMGDPEGARAMLDEVFKDGTQIQRDVASKLMESLR